MLIYSHPPNSQLPRLPRPRHIQTFPFPTIGEGRGGARSRTQNGGGEEKIIMAMTKTKSGIRSQVSKNRSGKLDYFCSHTVFLEVAAVSVSQQGDLQLRQQFGLGHNITKLRRNYPALIGLARPFRNNQRQPQIVFLRGLARHCGGLIPPPASSHQMLSIRILIGIIDMLSLTQHWIMQPHSPQIAPSLMTRSGDTLFPCLSYYSGPVAPLSPTQDPPRRTRRRERLVLTQNLISNSRQRN